MTWPSLDSLRKLLRGRSPWDGKGALQRSEEREKQLDAAQVYQDSVYQGLLARQYPPNPHLVAQAQANSLLNQNLAGLGNAVGGGGSSSYQHPQTITGYPGTTITITGLTNAQLGGLTSVQVQRTPKYDPVWLSVYHVERERVSYARMVEET